ncbi:MAG: type I-MYXAN CRISPR-associated Cas8a1/Cmx1 [Deltaproteobacteria bacterium]|nr:type I-MYXAN CRISPR-associated Cas8a1/Cmx1 [Deltaproteobacteria bacterium]
MEKTVMGNHLTPKVQWSLTDEGMGVLERAGLGGLYLSLTAADEWAAQGDSQVQELQRLLTWELSDHSVKLWWEGEDQAILTKLVEWAWQEREGVFYLPGLHRSLDEREHIYKRLDIHRGLFQTFFQHPKVLPREQPITEIVKEDEHHFFQINYQKIKPRKGGLPTVKILPEILKQGMTQEAIHLSASWIYPGAAKRFGKAAKKEENWSGPPKLGLLLIFAPLSCVFFELPMTKIKAAGRGQFRPNWAFLVPEIKSLTTFAKHFPLLRCQAPADFLRVRVQSLGDAALSFASAYAARGMERRLGLQKVYIAAMGQVSHYQGQKVRKKILELRPAEISIKRYERMIRYLPNEFRTRQIEKTEDPAQVQANLWIRQPTARGRIADNLIHDRPWYQDLLWPHPWQVDKLENQRQRTKQKEQKSISLEHLWFNNLLFERRALMNLADETVMWDSPEEQALLSIFHHSLRQLLNKDEEAQKRGGSRNLLERWDDRVQAVRRGLMRAKTRELNRKFIMEFLAEGGGSKELTEKKEALWRFLNHPYDWQKSRDLALLALVTFTDKRLGKPKETSEKGEDSSDE